VQELAWILPTGVGPRRLALGCVFAFSLKLPRLLVEALLSGRPETPSPPQGPVFDSDTRRPTGPVFAWIDKLLAVRDEGPHAVRSQGRL
jgi:hypothetical protein